LRSKKARPFKLRADFDVTFQKIHFEVVLLKDEMKTQDYRIADYPFSCISQQFSI